MYTVFVDRNKQYCLKKKSSIIVDFLDLTVGEEIVFDKILCLDNGESLEIGDPFLSGRSLKFKVISHFKDKKKVVLKFKRRKNYLRKKGHRQKYTLLEFVSFN